MTTLPDNPLQLPATECVIGRKKVKGSCYDAKDVQAMSRATHNKRIKHMTDAELRDYAEHHLNRHDDPLSSQRSKRQWQEWARCRYKPGPPVHPKGWLSNYELTYVLTPFFKQKEAVYGGIVKGAHAPLPYVKRVPNGGQGWIVHHKNHWTSCFAKGSRYYYYDSECHHPPWSVAHAMANVKKNKGRVWQNKIKSQHELGECGVFAIYFLLFCLTGQDPRLVDEQDVSDKEMRHFRRKLFNRH